MLRQILIVHSPARPFCRSYSIPPPYGDVFKNNKLRACKFESSPQEALKNMGAWAAVLNSTTFTEMLRSVGSMFLPSIFEGKPPIRWSAVYFPAWIIEADVEGFCNKSGNRQYLQIRNRYIPGADTPLLSAAPLWDRLRQPVPFTEDLLHQHGQKVQCIPFNVSPFSVFQMIQSCDSEMSVKITRDMSIRPSSIKTHLFAAYPVLLPLYVAQYQIDENPAHTKTLFTPGGSDCEDVMAPNFQGDNQILDMAYDYLRRHGYSDSGLDAEVWRFLPASKISQHKPVELWYRDQIHNSSNISYLASFGPLKSDDDLRIREKSKATNDEMERYFKLVSEKIVLKKIIATTDSADHAAKVLTFGGGNGPRIQGTEDATKMLKGKLEDVEEKRRNARPQWWIDWESSHKSESESK